MRDFLLNESVKRLATEAATRLSSMVAMGEEIPFDVAADAGDDSAFYSYVPMTGRYVADHAEELRALPSFGPAREAAVEAGVAASYLEERGQGVPADPGARAELMLITFFAELWEGSAGFALDRERLETALATLDAESRDADDAEVLIVPIVGLRMSMPRLQLAPRRPHRPRRLDRGAGRRDAQRGNGPRRLGAAVPGRRRAGPRRRGRDRAAAAARAGQRDEALQGGRHRPRPLRLRPHRRGLLAADRHRRPRDPRPAATASSEAEAEELIEFGTALEARPDPDSALTWAVGRFEMGCERPTALEGLSDHLLAMRAVLEGHGPVGASLPLRAAALIADEEMDRIEAGERVEEVLGLERATMNGRPVERAVELAAWLEENARKLLRQAALGELGNDLSTVADETLIVSGLAEGDAEIMVSIEEAPEPEIDSEPDFVPEPEPEEISIEAFDPEPSAELQLPVDELPEEEYMEQETRIMEPIPAEDEIRITATPWLEEVSDPRGGETIEWPADSDRDIQHREKVDTPRVRHLFPVPEDADWEVSHLEFEYSRNRAR